jgi:hypothetical protein
MIRTDSGTAERIAAAFHAAYETLAPSAGYETRKESAVPWADVPASNKALMIATVEALLGNHMIKPGPASGNPANIGHGHVRPRPDGMKARCGGPGQCSQCSIEFAQLNA